MIEIFAGDRVKLLGLPEWLLHDLPETEQQEMQTFIGKSTTVSSIDKFGYYWLGFGATVDLDARSEASSYSGHSFCVPRNFIELDI